MDALKLVAAAILVNLLWAGSAFIGACVGAWPAFLIDGGEQ